MPLDVLGCTRVTMEMSTSFGVVLQFLVLP